MEDDQVVRITGDPESPVNRGRLCSKGANAMKYLRHPARLTHPLRRVGERGGGQWEAISWEEALDTTAGKLNMAKTDYGPESVIFLRGSFKGGYEGAYVARFANAFGTPNIASMSSVCFVPRVNGSVITHGFLPVPDYRYPPACIMVWGANLSETRLGEGMETLDAVEKGSKLIVVDPRTFHLSRKAEIRLPLRPGSDLALALGLIHVIIADGLYDSTFVDKWTVGFRELKGHVEQYSPDVVEKITWVPADMIKEAARLYATAKPAVLQAGNAIDHNGNNFQTARAFAILRAITGNIGLPGGEVACSGPPVIPMGSPEFDLRDMLSNEARSKRLNVEDGFLPSIFYALPQSIVKSVLSGEPYRLRAAYVLGANPLLTYTNAQEVYKAFREIDFLAVADIFMTPTAAMADIIFPAAMFLETDGIIAPPYYPVAQVQQKVAHPGECRSDYEILSGLARKVGISCFWESERECLDYILRPAGLTFEEFGKVGALVGKKEYRKHEREGFATPSKKVELYSERLKDWGFDPLPTHREIPESPLSAPGLAAEYPLVLTSWKTEEFRHSGERQIEALRKLHPEPVVWVHPDTAAQLGIDESDLVYIETKRGRIKQRAHLTSDIDRRVVGVDYGWWFPEKGSEGLYGWAEGNVNILTDDARPWGREMGTPSLRGFLCKIYKA
jgi:anaerobic selenocysteine-containing dehydrogenase